MCDNGDHATSGRRIEPGALAPPPPSPRNQDVVAPLIAAQCALRGRVRSRDPAGADRFFHAVGSRRPRLGPRVKNACPAFWRAFELGWGESYDREAASVNVALYARVSTDGQDPEVQLAALRAHAAQRGLLVVEEFVDRGISGATNRRPALDRLMRTAWEGRFQAVLVWRFDRFARSVKHLITALDTFSSLGVEFISMQEQFDTSTPIGHAMFTVIGAMAELERGLIRERVKAGLDRAKAKGVRLGRPTVPVDPDELQGLRSQGLSIGQIAKRARCSPATVRRRLREAGIASETARE